MTKFNGMKCELYHKDSLNSKTTNRCNHQYPNDTVYQLAVNNENAIK